MARADHDEDYDGDISGDGGGGSGIPGFGGFFSPLGQRLTPQNSPPSSARSLMDGSGANFDWTGKPISEGLLDFVKQKEGEYLDAYRCPAGVLTIGYGHTGPDVQAGMHISKEEAVRLLKQDLQICDGQVKHALGDEAYNHLNANQRAALTSFVFNLGPGNLAKSGIPEMIRAGNFAGASREMLLWDKAHVDGVLTSLPGLTKRRHEEAALFDMPVASLDLTASADAPKPTYTPSTIAGLRGETALLASTAENPVKLSPTLTVSLMPGSNAGGINQLPKPTVAPPALLAQGKLSLGAPTPQAS